MLLSRLFKTNVGRVFAKLHSDTTNGVGGKSEREAVNIVYFYDQHLYQRLKFYNPHISIGISKVILSIFSDDIIDDIMWIDIVGYLDEITRTDLNIRKKVESTYFHVFHFRSL